MALAHPGVSNSVAFPGLSINGFVNAPNAGIAFVTLKPSDERAGKPGLDANSIVGDLNQRFGGIQDAFVAIFPPPPVQGLGTVGGFKLYVEDRASLGFEELYTQMQGAAAEGQKAPELAGLFSSFQVSVPQIDVHVDRERVKTYGVALTDVFDTLQVYLGLALRQRLQPLRPHLPGERAGGVGVPPAAGADRAARRRETRRARWCRSDRCCASAAATGRIR